MKIYFSPVEALEDGQPGAGGRRRVGEHHRESSRDGGPLRALLRHDHHIQVRDIVITLSPS